MVRSGSQRRRVAALVVLAVTVAASCNARPLRAWSDSILAEPGFFTPPAGQVWHGDAIKARINQIPTSDPNSRVIAEGTAAELKSSLGRTIVEVDFRDAETAERALPVLAGLGDASVLTTTVSLKVDDGSDTLFAVVRALDAAAISAVNVTVREPSLDDVFLTLTGHRSSEDNIEIEVGS